MALMLISVAGCTDAPSGPFTVTVNKHSIGVVLSDPPGLSCGMCNLETGTAPLTCPFADPTHVGTDCSHVFDAGTQLTFSLVGHDIYDQVWCQYGQNGPPLQPCTFVVTQDVTVAVTGTAAFQ
jgi:hypothetical protein